MISWDVCLIVVSHLDDDELDFGNYKTEDWPDQRSDRSKYRHQNTEDFRIKIIPNSSPSLTILGIPTIFVSRQNFRIIFGWLFPCKHVFWGLLICLVCQQTFQLVVSLCVLVFFFFLVLLMGVVSFLESFNDIVVISSPFLCSNSVVWVLKINQILGGHDSLKSVSNHDNCHGLSLLFLDVWNSSLHFVLRLGVKRWSCFIQNQNLWLLNQRSCDGNALFLTTRKIEHASHTNKGI